MKLLIVVVLVTLVVVGGLTMFLTGSFKRALPEEELLAEVAELDGTGQTAETGTDIEGEVGDAKSQRAAKSQKAAESPEIAESQEERTARLLTELQAKLTDHESRLATAEAKQAEYESRVIAAEAALAATTAGAESLAARTQEMAKLYGAMKPDSAATILCKLEQGLSMRILREMNSRASSKLMEAITTTDPDYAIKISELMANPDTPGS